MSLDVTSGLGNTTSIPSSYTAKGNHMLEKQVHKAEDHLSIGARARLLVQQISVTLNTIQQEQNQLFKPEKRDPSVRASLPSIGTAPLQGP